MMLRGSMCEWCAYPKRAPFHEGERKCVHTKNHYFWFSEECSHSHAYKKEKNSTNEWQQITPRLTMTLDQ